MISFLLSVVLLIAGYFVYGKYVARVFGVDTNRTPPAQRLEDGVDYIVMPTWKVFLIQFLNIAGLGPIFGAIAGAMFGPIAFLWIVVGSIFAGGTHDFLAGMTSMRQDGLSITEIVGQFLGKHVKLFMCLFTIVLMVLVGAVFMTGPAKIIDGMSSGVLGVSGWVAIILVYYILSTLLPIDKLIGRIYPVFGIALLFMACGIFGVLLFGDYTIPELDASTFHNMKHNADSTPIFPMLFISIACGAISGFHATQSPLMARCLKNESLGRPVFYGAMIAEGLVALIWAAAAMAFFGGVDNLNAIMAEHGNNAAWAANEISRTMLGKLGGVLALLGIVAAPITSGDTAFRSARLILADMLNIKQKKLSSRIYISIPLFIVAFGLTLIDFSIVWRYFAWFNQTLAVIVLWGLTGYLIKEKKNYIITTIPAIFMTIVCISYILIAKEGLGLDSSYAYLVAGSISALIGYFVMRKFRKDYPTM